MTRKKQNDDLMDFLEEETGIKEADDLLQDNPVDDLEDDIVDDDEPVKTPENMNKKPPSEVHHDLEDDIEYEEDFDELNNYEEDESTYTEDQAVSFAQNKRLDKKKKVLGSTLFVVGIMVMIGMMFLDIDLEKKKKEEKEDPLVKTKELLEQMEKHDPNTFRNMEARKKQKEVNAPLKEETKPVERKFSVKKKTPVKRKPRRRRKKAYGNNYHEDKRIIDKYKNINPEDAADTTVKSGFTIDMIEPDSGDSGIKVIGADPNKKKNKNKNIVYDIEIKAFLKKGIRSTASSMVVAQTKKKVKDFPINTNFYGTARFSNHRTYISFTYAVLPDGTKINLEGEAMIGKDPGIHSRVTAVEKVNADKSFKSAIIGTTAKVADNVISRATGGATSGTLSDPAGDLQAKQEQEKQQFEYYVPARTSFIIYVY